MSNSKITELEQWGPIDTRPLYMSFWFTASAGYACWPEMLAILDHDRITFRWRGQEMQSGGEMALRQILDRKKRGKLWKKYSNQVKLIEAASKKDCLSTGQWYKYWYLFWQTSLIVETANFASPGFLRKKIEKIIPEKELDKVLEILLAPERLSFHQQSELELLQTNDLKKYAKKWFWVENSYYESKVLTADFFKSQIKSLKKKARETKIRTILDYVKEVRRKKRSIIKKYRLPKEIANQAAAMAFSIWWQDHRKGIAWRSSSVIDRINEKLSLRFSLTENDLMHYTAEEWVRLGEKSVMVQKKIISQRKKLVIFEFLNNDFKLYYGKQAKKIINKWQSRVNRKSDNEMLRGIVVSTSRAKKIRGPVCILSSPRFASKMKSGDILVAPMTSPDYIQAMRKAKAIITDTGGLMSHAAVVSRELGIPCIVNTKIATKVLRDGDLVEVDANAGVVRILRKK